MFTKPVLTFKSKHTSEPARDGIDSIFRFVPNLSWHLPGWYRYLSLLKRFIKSIKMAQLQERLLP
jgi:hypothetical protein